MKYFVAYIMCIKWHAAGIEAHYYHAYKSFKVVIWTFCIQYVFACVKMDAIKKSKL